MKRIAREKTTIKAMVTIFCRSSHGTESEVCGECIDFLSYAYKRLDKCPFQENKTTCAKCPRHCYKSDIREKARKIMRFSGPRMIYRHPYLAIRHSLDGFQKKPERKKE